MLLLSNTSNNTWAWQREFQNNQKLKIDIAILTTCLCQVMCTYHIENRIWNVLDIQYIPRNMHTVFALLCFVVVIHWLIFPYPSGLLHWHCGNLTIAPVPAKQPWWIWINTSCEFIMNDCITTTKQSTTKPCAYFWGYTVWCNKLHTQKYYILCNKTFWSNDVIWRIRCGTSSFRAIACRSPIISNPWTGLT